MVGESSGADPLPEPDGSSAFARPKSSNVGGFQIPMNNVTFVGRLQRRCDLKTQLQGFFRRDWTALDDLRQRFAIDKFQDEKLCGAGFFQSVYRCDVLMVERGEQFGFPVESGQAIAIRRELFRQCLDGNLAPSLVSVAFHTSPMPPRPMAERTS
jgi:hypothetical protein